MRTRRDIIKSGLGLAGIIAASKAPAAIVRSLIGADGIETVPDDILEPTARDYVQDGLFALWDGIENSGFGEHDPDLGAKWIDCIGGYQLVPYQNSNTYVWHDDHISKTSVVRRGLYCSAMDNICDTVPTIHFELICRRDTALDKTSSKSLFGTVGPNLVTLGDAMARDRVFPNGRQGLNYGYFSASPMVVNQMSVTVGASGIEDYNTAALNGKSGSLLSGREWTVDLGNTVSILGGVSSYGACAYSCWALRLYDRPLTVKEIQWNYKIDKMRFGL